MKKPYKTIASVLFVVIIILFSANLLFEKFQARQEIEEIELANERTINEVKEIKETKITLEAEIEEPETSQEPETLPETGYLNVGFFCQAPLETEANWVYHEESCEEAALLQTYLYERGEEITKEEANTILLDMIAWQEENMGGHFDLYADEMKEFIMGYYQLEDEDVVIIYDASLEDIKKEINLGHPVIAPVTSGLLSNPYYPYPGYHMLAVTGYTKDRIITNDNGTKRGKDFSYDNAEFETALRDAGGDIITLRLKD